MHAKQRMLINASPYLVADKVVLTQQLHTRLLKKAETLELPTFFSLSNKSPLHGSNALKHLGPKFSLKDIQPQLELIPQVVLNCQYYVQHLSW